MSSFQTDATSTRGARQDGIEKAGVVPCGCDPVVKLLVASIFLFDADSGAVGTAEIDCSVDQLLQDDVGVF
jgi:hypothetical protein